MWPQQNLCEYPIVKMNMEQRPAANQSFLETIHSQVKQKTKSNYLNVTILMNTFLLFHGSGGFNYSYAYCGYLPTCRCHYSGDRNRPLYSSVEKKE